MSKAEELCKIAKDDEARIKPKLDIVYKALKEYAEAGSTEVVLYKGYWNDHNDWTYILQKDKDSNLIIEKMKSDGFTITDGQIYYKKELKEPVFKTILKRRFVLFGPKVEYKVVSHYNYKKVNTEVIEYNTLIIKFCCGEDKNEQK